uniref:RecF/RecN/SMC N-terminal domain-containing protein n=1 Tax=candidate division WOR-3 bacterium TaxID=2052148 RepID=A0A7V3ZUI7_UNCW3
MRIKEISIFGFKSFPEKTRILFSKGITAILGPNGCGKTNIFDAFRWVLGEQSLSLLRCHRTEELIFGGTKTIPPLNYCEVKLIIENEGEWPEYSTEIEIKRSYYRSGESEYFINRQPCRLKDVQDLFANIGSSAYSIFDINQIRRIIQGEIKEFLYEVSALKSYFENKKEIEKKLNSLNQELENMEIIIKEKQRTVRNLQKQVKAYNEYLQLKEKEKICRRNLLLKEIKKLKKLKEDLEKEILKENERLCQKEKEIEFLLKEINENQKEIEEIKQKKENLYEEYQILKKELNSLERESFVYEEKKNLLIKELEKSESTKENLFLLLKNLETENRQLKENLDRFDSEKKDLEEKIKVLRKELEEKGKLINQLEDEIQNFWKLLRRNFEERRLLESSLLKIDSEITRIKNSIKENQIKKEEMEKEIGSWEKKLITKEKILDELKSQYFSILKEKENQELMLLKNQLGNDFLGTLKDFLIIEENYQDLINQLLKDYLNFYIIKNFSLFDNFSSFLNKGFILLPLGNKEGEEEIQINNPPLPLKNLVKFKENCPEFIKQKIEECYLVNNLKEGYYFYLKKPNFNYLTKNGEVITKEGIIDLRKINNWQIPPVEVLKIYAEIYSLTNLSEIYYQKKNLLMEYNKQIEKEEQTLNAYLLRKKEIENKMHILNEEEKLLKEKLRIKEENLNTLRNKFKSKNEEAHIFLNKLLGLKEKYYQEEQNFYKKEIEKEKIKKEINELNEKVESIKKEISQIENDYIKLCQKIFELKEKKQFLEGQLPEKLITNLITQIQEKNKKVNEYQKECSLIKDIIAQKKINLAGIEKELEINMANFVKEFSDFQDNNESDIDDLKYETELNMIREKLLEIGNVNPLAVEDYNNERTELLNYLNQKKDILQGIANLKKSAEELERKAKEIFCNTFENIRKEFKNTFTEIFLEGEADIIISEPENVFESPIIITAKPKGKNPKRLEHLSDGEKALLALSLLFAFYRIKKTPFLLLDEVDAPLDDINIKRFVKFLKELSHETQIIIITHNRLTLENADILLGVTTIEPGISKVFTIKVNS